MILKSTQPKDYESASTLKLKWEEHGPMFTDPRFKPNCLDYEFIRFHNRNPQVLQHLVTEALGVYGGRRMSVKYFFELLRINGFKLSNNLHSRYARLMMNVEPRLFGAFRTRSLA